MGPRPCSEESDALLEPHETSGPARYGAALPDVSAHEDNRNAVIRTVCTRGCLALNVVFDIERELERADALGAFLSMDEYSPDALVASLELLTKRARHVPQN